MEKTVTGVINDRQDAEEAIEELKTLNFDTKELSIVMKDYRKIPEMNVKAKKMAEEGEKTNHRHTAVECLRFFSLTKLY